MKHLTLERMMKYFFVAGHVQYARHLTQYLLDMRAVRDVDGKPDLVCRHSDGFWNAVSADQFGEQTGIKIGKGSLKGMTLSPELVSEWIDAFPITVHVSDSIDNIYPSKLTGQDSQKKHKEEQKHRRLVDFKDRELLASEVAKYPHPLNDVRPHLYNPVSGQIAPPDVNVTDSLVIGDKMERSYKAGLPGGFYNPISSKIKTMAALKKKAKTNQTKSVINPQNIFMRLLVIGQKLLQEVKWQGY